MVALIFTHGLWGRPMRCAHCREAYSDTIAALMAATGSVNKDAVPVRKLCSIAIATNPARQTTRVERTRWLYICFRMRWWAMPEARAGMTPIGYEKSMTSASVPANSAFRSRPNAFAGSANRSGTKIAPAMRPTVNNPPIAGPTRANFSKVLSIVVNGFLCMGPGAFQWGLTNSVYLTLRQRWTRGAVVHGVR